MNKFSHTLTDILLLVSYISNMLCASKIQHKYYVSSKGAIMAMTRVLSRELGEDGICVNTISPGLTMSENVLNSEIWMESRDLNKNTRALKRYQTPDDLIGTLIFLSSEDSYFMTGQSMVVDGGSANN